MTIYANQADPTAATILVSVTPGSYDIDLPLADWAKNWATISVELVTVSGLNQNGSPPFSSYDLFRTQYRIDQTFTCTNKETSETSGWVITSYTASPDPNTKCEISAEVRVLCFAGRGVSSVFYRSSTLATCQGCTINDRNFQPVIDGTANVDPAVSSQICICATGGSGDYKYSIVSGSLPSGQTLNPDTGCIEGNADGHTPGTPSITFRVTDAGGAGAPVGTSRTIGGTGYLNGSNFVWASGAAFFSEMAGTSITIGGAGHTVATVPTQFTMTVS